MRKFSFIAVLVLLLAAVVLTRRGPRLETAAAAADTTLSHPSAIPSVLRPPPSVRSAASDWPSRFLAADSPARAALLAEGRVWAAARRAAMKELIVRDPQRALEAALPFELRENLPTEILSRIERVVSARGSFEVVATCDYDGQADGSPLSYAAQVGDERFTVHTFGRRLDVTTKKAMSLWGVAVDGELALREEPVRVLGTAEKVARGFSGSTIVAELAGVLREFADEAALESVRARLLAEENAANPNVAASPDGAAVQSAGGGDGEIALTSAWTEGPKTLLWITADFPDTQGWPQSLATISNTMATLTNYFREASFGRMTMTVTVCTNLVSLTNNASYYTNRFGTLLQHARDLAKSNGYDYAGYDLYGVFTDENTTNGGNFAYAGKAYIGSAGTHLVDPYYTLRTTGHELGHNLGLQHANYWRTDSDWCIGQDTLSSGYVTNTTGAERIEYGHRFTLMSAQTGTDMDNGTAHFAAREKLKLNWITSTQSVTTTTGGVFRIGRHDSFGATNAVLSVTINKTTGDYTLGGRQYNLSYRRRFSAYPTQSRGIEVDFVKSSYGSDGAILLDMTPFSNDDAAGASWTDDNTDKQDAALLIGRTYSDILAGIHITPTALGGDVSNEWVDVTVKIGSFPTNRRPDLVLTANTNAAATGAWVGFTATASDLDGDALAYEWHFTTPTLLVTNSLNAASCSNKWSAAGQYVVRCTVSDMKGGLNITSLLVTVGGSTNPSLRGNVFWNGYTGGVENVRIYTGNTNSTWTLSDGSYILPNFRGSATNVVRAMRLGYLPSPSHPTNLIGGVTHSNLHFAVPGTGILHSATASVTEGAATNLLIRLLGPPTGLVTLATSGDTNQLAGNSVILTPTNWIQGALLSIATTDDTTYEPAATTSLVATAATSTDLRYEGRTSEIAVIIFDNDQLVDNDADGMIDAYELTHFGNPTNAAATADTDTDGHTNLDEYIADTDPTNAFSFLTLTNPPPEFIVNALSNRTYTLQATHDLATTNWQNIATAPGANAPLLLLDTNAHPSRFYRLRVTLP